MQMRIAALAGTLLLGLSAAGAHELDNGPHGGRVVEAGAYHVELIVKDSAVEVFLTDASDKPVSAAGFKGVAIFTVSGKAQRIVLEPKEGASLAGTSATVLPPTPSGVVQLTAPGGKTTQGRFR
jgi:hypothetical protein